jgi:hypothetical protein
MALIKTKIPGYYKDDKSNLVVCMNKDSLKQTIIARNKSIELNSLKSELNDLKRLIGTIINKEGN